MRLVKNNKGISLIELIIAITIMAVLVGFVTPQYMKYVTRSRKTVDMNTAARIGDIITRGMVDNPEAYATFMAYKPTNDNLKPKLSATVGGVKETPYEVYLLMVNEDRYKYWFYGGMNELKWKNDNNIGFYNYINQELGFEGVVKGNGNWTAVRENTAAMPQYKKAPDTTTYKIDRWRIVKRVDNGAIEVWSACDYHDGKSYGGKPCYRVWPNPDDVYTK